MDGKYHRLNHVLETCTQREASRQQACGPSTRSRVPRKIIITVVHSCKKSRLSCFPPYNNTTAMRMTAKRFIPGSRIWKLPGSLLIPMASQKDSDSSSKAESSEAESRKSSSGAVGNAGGASTGSGSQRDPDKDDPKQEPWRPWGWISQLLSTLSLGQPLRVLLNLGLIFLLIRLWPLGGKTSNTEGSQSVVVVVPFSEFMRQVSCHPSCCFDR